MKPNPKEIHIILNILKGAQFEFLPRAPFDIDTPLHQHLAALWFDQFLTVKMEAISSSETFVISTRLHASNPRK
jgi:hypothetical protein